MDLVVVEGSQGVSRHGVRSWCGVVGGTWQRFPEIASENEQKLSLRGVLSLGKGQSEGRASQDVERESVEHLS